MSRKCCVCGGSQATVLYRPKTKLSEDASGSFSPVARDFGIYHDILKCDTCGLVYAEQVDTPGELLDHYVNAEDTGEYTGAREQRERNFQRGCALLEPYLSRNPGCRVLDVGAGAGIFVNLMQKQGFAVSGVELSKDLVKQAKANFNISLFNGMLKDAGFPPESYDLITMFEVIEHLGHPEEEIERVARLLKRGGHLLIVTPDIGSLSARLLGRRWWSFRQMHLFYFSRITLTKLLANYGLKPLAMGCYTKTFKLSYYLSAILKRPVKIPAFLDWPIMTSLGDMVGVYEKS